MDFLDELNQQGHTIIMITHDMQHAGYSDRAIVVVDGQIFSRPVACSGFVQS